MKHIVSIILLLTIGVFVMLIWGSGTITNNPTPYPWPPLKLFPKMPDAANNPVSIEGAKLGRYLFYDPILSYDSTFSCASCHNQESAFSDFPKQFSKGINGDLMTRNTMPLFNLAWYPAMHWDGKVTSIEEQVFHPVMAENEMDFDWKKATLRIRKSKFYQPLFNAAFGDVEIDSNIIAKAIAQFERTLISNNSKFDSVIRGQAYFTTKEYEGFVLINDQTKGDCLHCHTTDADALGTSRSFSNNGLDPAQKIEDYKDSGKGGITKNAKDYGHFKIPSLRNIAVTAPYMHDGRLKTLEDVIDFYSEEVNAGINTDSKMGFAHQGGAHLSVDEKAAIIAFLHTLTDNSFLTNQEFGNPF
jgi:cytochrome c peroxidase